MNSLGINWIDPYSCDSFSKFKGTDLQELIIQIEDFYLIYRESINISERITFGFEIEFENHKKNLVENFIAKKNLSMWNCTYDGSVSSGGEIRSPIMSDKKRYWQELQKICKYLKKNNVNTCGNAGGHIHVGTPILGNNVLSWQNFLLLYATYEHILFRFLYGDKISSRENINKYAIPIREKIIEVIDSSYYDGARIEDLVSNRSLSGKYHAVNFGHVDYYNLNKSENKNTIEFRAPNATDEEVIWQNNTNAIIKLFLPSTNSNLDRDYLKFMLIRQKRGLSKIHYNEICLEDVLNYVDLVFTTNIDKIYFLRQYFKNFENNYGIKGAVLAKRFIEK